MKTLQERIRFVKEVTGWTNAELARQAVVSRTTPTDWQSGKSKVMSSVVAQNLSQKTPFTANWLATGSKPMYKAESDVQPSKEWPFPSISQDKVMALCETDLLRLDAAVATSAVHLGLDIKKTP